MFTEVDRESCRRLKNWRMVLRPQGMLTESPMITHKVDLIWQEVPQPHDKLTHVYSKSCRCMESRLMLTEGSAATQIFYGRSHRCTKSWRKLMEGTVDASKVDRSWQKTHDRSDSWLKVTKGPTNARNVNGSFRKRTNVDENLRKVLQLHESWRKVPRLHVKFT